ncbi:hypothetical protein PTTG_06733, partial [Puccinia triticina 1-1 BBBD Race 1]
MFSMACFTSLLLDVEGMMSRVRPTAAVTGFFDPASSVHTVQQVPKHFPKVENTAGTTSVQYHDLNGNPIFVPDQAGGSWGPGGQNPVIGHAVKPNVELPQGGFPRTKLDEKPKERFKWKNISTSIKNWIKNFIAKFKRAFTWGRKNNKPPVSGNPTNVNVVAPGSTIKPNKVGPGSTINANGAAQGKPSQTNYVAPTANSPLYPSPVGDSYLSHSSSSSSGSPGHESSNWDSFSDGSGSWSPQHQKPSPHPAPLKPSSHPPPLQPSSHLPPLQPSWLQQSSAPHHLQPRPPRQGTNSVVYELDNKKLVTHLPAPEIAMWVSVNYLPGYAVTQRF